MPLQHLIIVGRHGERRRLVKHSKTLQEESAETGGPPLTPAGLSNISAVGRALRARYLAVPSCDTTCLLGFSSDRVRVESSGLARTLGTATVMLDALLPPQLSPPPRLPIPIFTAAGEHVLRGYHDCPALGRRVDAWLENATVFASKEAASLPLRRAMAAALHAAGEPADGEPMAGADGGVPLKEAWNAYDALATREDAAVGAELLSRAAALAAWLEAHKFGLATGGALRLMAELISAHRRAHTGSHISSSL